jgi:hypothetical protein
MRKLLVAAAFALSIAAPAGAQRVFTPEMDEDIARAIPPAEEVEAVGERLDQVLGALLDVPVGPLVDAVRAADPETRGRRYADDPRTLRDIAGRDDPGFEARLHDDVRGVTAGMGRTMEQLAVIAPLLRRALADAELGVEEAIEEGRRARDRRAPDDRDW